MPVIQWSDHLSVGIDALDSDHKMLIDIINELYEAMSQGRGLELVDTIFVRLEQYTKAHFSREEALLESYDYPQLAGHKSSHAELIQELDRLRTAYVSERSGLMHIDVADFLNKWLIEHIQKDDFRYRDFLGERGGT